MNFFRMIKMDFTRMLLSGKFYFAIAGAMLVTVLNISQEAMQSRWNVSVTRTFRHGNFQASAHVTVEVRSDDNEGIVKADKTPRPGAGSAIQDILFPQLQH